MRFSPVMFFVLAIYVLPCPVAAQVTAAHWTLQHAAGDPERLKLSGTIRIRKEVLDGQFRPGFDGNDDLFGIRTTVFAEYDAGSVRVGAELYDSRAYDTGPGSVLTTGEVNALELVQAYVAVNLAKGAMLQAGRFMLNLGSRRLVAADDYRNTTNGYTGLRADWKARDGTTATLIYVLPQIRLPDGFDDLRANKVAFDRESFDLRLWGGLVAHPRTLAGATAEFSYFGLAEDDAPARPTRNRKLHSFGARLIREPAPGNADFEVEGIYQIGSIRSGLAASAARLDVAAYFLHADVGYSWPGRWKPRLSLEYDLASGDGPGRRFSRFDTLFGMRRADLAPAGIYAALGRTNIETVGVRMEAVPSRRTDGFLVGRALWAASATDAFSTTGIRDASGASGRFAGFQVEGRVRHWIVPQMLRGEVNGAWLMKRGILHDAPNAPRYGDTHYLSFALTVSF
jgi:hypothetical protein